MTKEQRLEAILITWDENEIPSAKRLLTNADQIEKHVRQELNLPRTFPLYFLRPEKTIWQFGTDLQEFWHDGKFIQYQGKEKDLAIVKYCTIGLVDQDEYYHQILIDFRYNIYPHQFESFLDKNILVVFLTSDRAQGMVKALKWYQDRTSTGLPNVSPFVTVTFDHSRTDIKGDARLKDIASGIARGLKQFVQKRSTSSDRAHD